MASVKSAIVNKDICVACGVCVKECFKNAVSIYKGCYAAIDAEKCIGCGKCARSCPAGCITTVNKGATA